MRRFLSGLLVLFFHFSTFATTNDGAVLFVAYEAAEVRAFEEIVPLLEERKINYKIIAFGIAHNMLKHHPRRINIHKKCNIKAHIRSKGWEASQRISEADIAKITKCIKPMVVVVGTSSVLQAQISQAFANKDARIIAFFPQISPFFLGSPEQAVSQYAHLIVVATSELKQAFENIPGGGNSRVKVLGHPSLEAWQRKISELNRELLSQEFGFTKDKRPFILYIGGYGEGYEQSFEMFVQAMARMPDKNVVIKLHPKVDGATEKAILAMYNVKNYHFLPPADPYKAAALAECVVTQRSTAALQAYFANIPVIYLDARAGQVQELLVEKGNVAGASSAEEFLAAFSSLDKQKRTPEQITQLIGIPFGAAQAIADEIMSFLVQAKVKQDPFYNSETPGLSRAPL